MFLRDWMEGFSVIRKSKFLILFTIASLVANFSLAPIDVAITAWVKGPMGGAPLDLGIINGGFFTGVVLGGILVGFISKRIPMRILLLLGLVGVGTCVAALSLFRTVVPEASLTLIAGFALGNLSGSLNAMFTQMVPESMRGRAFGILGALSTLAMPLGMAILGSLIIHLSLELVFILIGALCTVSGLSFLLPVKDDKRQSYEEPRSGLLKW